VLTEKKLSDDAENNTAVASAGSKNTNSALQRKPQTPVTATTAIILLSMFVQIISYSRVTVP